MHRPSSARPDTAATPSAGLSLQLLGDPGVEFSGEDGTHRRVLGVGKPFALLAYLTVAPQHEASREFLADLLWGDNVVSDPLHNLRNTLLYLSTNVAPGLIEASRSRCRLAHILPSDLSALTDALQSHRLEDAMGLYAGEFLAGFAAPGCRQFELWCESVRLRVRTDVANAADVLVRQLMDAGKPRDAVGFARRMTDIEPHEQRSRRALLEALVAADDRMGALTEAALLEQWLQTEEMDAEPATRSIIALVRRAKPEDRRSSPPAGLAAVDETVTPDLIGRSAEFAAIVGAWDEARRGSTAYLAIVAGAGIGKSRLLADVENRLRAQRAQVVAVRALSDERDLSFAFLAALVHALAQIPGAAGVSGATGAVLVGLDPALASVFRAAPDHAAADPILRRARALHELLGCVADERSTALLLDDLHWADEASLETLRAALARLSGARLMVVTAARPGHTDVLPREHRSLELHPLSGSEVAQLISSIRPLPDAAWAREFALRVHAASRGVPLFALLAIRDGCERRLVRIGEREWECDDPAALDAGLLEGGALATAISGLPPRVMRALATMAIAGRAIPIRMLAEPSESAPSLAIDDAVAHLERTALAVTRGDSVATAHDVVTETVVSQLPDGARRTLTERLAHAMLQSEEPRWNERGVRLLASVSSAEEVARRVVPLLERARLPRGRAVTHTMMAWLGDSLEQRRFAGQVERKLPVRLRLRPFRRHLAAAGLAVAAFAALPLWSVLSPAVPVEATLVGIAMSGDSTVQASALTVTKSAWDSDSPLEARPTRLEGMTSPNMNSTLSARLFQRTGERLAEHVFDDSGGSDIELSDATGGTHRLTSSAGDDVPNSWSPDGRFVAFESSRWDPLRHHQIGILDRSTGAVRRLTHSDGSDGGGTWSPDGSRIAFARQFLDGRPVRQCVVDVDGGGERCTTGDAAGVQNIGWRSPVEYIGSSGTKLLAVRPDSAWSMRIIASDAFVSTLSPSGQWLAWFNASTTGAAFIAPSGNPEQARQVQWQRGGPVPSLLAWGARGVSAPFIERLVVHSSSDTVIVGVPHRFEIAARWSDSSDAPPPHVQWRVGARGNGSIDSAGTLIAERPGTIVVVASAGGWRTTSMRVVAVPWTSRRIVTEDWTHGLSAWRVFGDPTPAIVRDAQVGAALLNNGDGTYFSGAYRRTTVSWKFGLAVDAVISTPVTELQWQSVDLTLQASDYDQTLDVWDHRTGFLPTIGRAAGATCLFLYPAREGVDGTMTIIPGLAPMNSAPRRRLLIADGKPYRLRLQVFPDGRCGLALNGAPLYVSADRFRDNVPLRLVTYGSSWKTRMLLGPLTITQGVPRDIDWTHIARAIPPRMPSGPPHSTTPRPPK